MNVRRKKGALTTAAAALLTLAVASPSKADEASIERFYHNRAVTVTVGNSAGGGYDLMARLLAKHMGAFIPGQPNLVVENMTGAATIREANYIYSVAPKDGSVFGVIARGAVVQPLFAPEQFDGSKYVWLGSALKTTSTCVAWKTSPIKNWADVMSHEFIVAGQGPGADADIFSLTLKNLFGAKIRLVTGFPGTNDMSLSMVRGETDGFCGISYSTLKTAHSDWLRDKSIVILLQAGHARDPELAGVPFIEDLAKDSETLQILRVITAPQVFAMPFAVPPGTPPDRVAALRDAFEKTMKDPDFRAEAHKAGQDADPLSGDDVAKAVDAVYATPPDILAKAAAAMASPQQ